MKLATILRGGEPVPAIVLTDRYFTCKACVDLTRVTTLLEGVGANWRVTSPPGSVLEIVRGGGEALDNLKRLEQELRRLLDTGDHDAMGEALVAPEKVHWLPPIPNSPFFITLHGNACTIWRDRSQIKGDNRRHIGRVPMCRYHPATAIVGHLEPCIFPSGQSAGYGEELGIVIAPGGKNISYDDGMRHVYGITMTSDITRTATYREIVAGLPLSAFPWIRESGPRLGSAADASTPVGPWITTADEIDDLYDILMTSSGPDGGHNRSHTTGWIMGPDNILAYLARYMTVPAGAILQLGSAGRDGTGEIRGDPEMHGRTVESWAENLGKLSTPIWCEEESGMRREPGTGYYGLISRLRDCDVVSALSVDGGTFPQGTRTVWVAQFNDVKAAKRKEYSLEAHRRVEVCPRSTLAVGDPVVFEPHVGDMHVSVELAAVVADRPVARISPEQVPDFLTGVTIMIGMRDLGLLGELELPHAFEYLFSMVQGRWGDGYNSIRPELGPVEFVRAGEAREMRIALAGGTELVTTTDDYVWGLDELISFISQEITLLPGDVVSLGSAGQWLILPEKERLPADAKLRASIGGLGDFEVPVEDRRGPHPPLCDVT